MADLEGETIELDEDELPEVEDTEDGGAIVRLEEEGPAKGDSPFYANLAEDIPEDELQRIGTRFLELIAKDKEARKKRDDQYEEGLRRTGMGDDAPGGAQFTGASRVVHPMLTEACVDFAARAMKELFPAQGPAKDSIVGEQTEEKIEKAKRKTALMNWQLTTQAQEFRAELEQLLTQVPLGGAQYLKLSWDERRNRPGFLFVAIDDIYLPYAATNFYSAQRKTHVEYLTQLDFEQRVRSGMYRDVDLVPEGTEPDLSATAKANNKIEGRSETSYNEDGLREIYQIYAVTDIGDDDEPSPYILSVDKSSGKVLSIYRNWDEEDDSREELQWIVEFPFVPWRGAYPIGLPQMVGGLSAAATGALRALLDSAHIQNVPTALKLKGGTRGGQSLNVQPTQVMEIEGGVQIDDVRKLIMPMPFNQPSPVLFQLLGFLVDAGRGVVRTTMEDIADGNADAPVGTTLAKLEQGMVVFSAIHSRLHNAMARVLRILHRLNAMYLDDEDVEAEVGEELATRKDFDGPMDVVPVSDPNIFSEAQRFAQVQAVAQRAQLFPQLYNLRKVEERILDTLKIPNAEDLLAPAVEPEQQNAVNENVAATLGRAIVAFPEQDHIAHLATHLAYMTNSALGGNPLIAPTLLPIMLGHIKEHIALWYMMTSIDAAEDATGLDLDRTLKEHQSSEESRGFDRMMAQASMVAVEQATDVFSDLPGVIQQAQQMLQQMQGPAPMDPTQVAMQDVQARTQVAQGKLALDREKLQITAQADQAKEAQRTALETQRQQHEDARTQAEIQSRMAMNEADNQTAMDLAELELLSGARFPASTGTGINP